MKEMNVTGIKLMNGGEKGVMLTGYREARSTDGFIYEREEARGMKIPLGPRLLHYFDVLRYYMARGLGYFYHDGDGEINGDLDITVHDAVFGNWMDSCHVESVCYDRAGGQWYIDGWVDRDFQIVVRGVPVPISCTDTEEVIFVQLMEDLFKDMNAYMQGRQMCMDGRTSLFGLDPDAEARMILRSQKKGLIQGAKVEDGKDGPEATVGIVDAETGEVRWLQRSLEEVER